MKKRNAVTITGIFLILSGLFILVKTVYPIVFEEARYQIKQVQTKAPNSIELAVITPIDTEFSIQIPKINANAKIIANVDPYNEKEYQKKLSQGVAHSKGSALPDTLGNMFLFAHSSQDFFVASRYNAVFYLLNKLEQGDSITIYYKNTPYVYQVTNKRIVLPQDVQYMKSIGNNETLTLMTCWPAGTTFKRLLIKAERKISLDEAKEK